MKRRQFLRGSAAAMLTGFASALTGCRGQQFGRVMNDHQADRVGSHAAGAETFRPLVEQTVDRLLARTGSDVRQVSTPPGGAPRVCFVGLDNRSAEELCDFKDQLVDCIQNRISYCQSVQLVSKHFVEAGLRELHLRPEALFLPANQRRFLTLMESHGQPFDYLLFANLTSGTTRTNGDSQRDYQLTLELVDIRTGNQVRESERIRKSYHQTRMGSFLSR